MSIISMFARRSITPCLIYNGPIGVMGWCAAVIIFCDSCIYLNSYSASLRSFCINANCKIMLTEYAMFFFWQNLRFFFCDESLSTYDCRRGKFPKLVKLIFSVYAEVSHSKQNRINVSNMNEEDFLPSKA